MCRSVDDLPHASSLWSRTEATTRSPARCPTAQSGKKPWLKSFGLGMTPVAAKEKQEDADLPTRKRPLIYVYDSPPPYTGRMLQYRLVWKACVWRHFNAQNVSELHDWLYGVESYFHDTLLTSPHR